MEEHRDMKMRNFKKNHEHNHAAAVNGKPALEPKFEERKQ